jgi:hypothetical protein
MDPQHWLQVIIIASVVVTGDKLIANVIESTSMTPLLIYR